MDAQIQEQLKIACAESQEVLSKAQETIGQVEQSEALKVTFKSALKILKERRDVLVEAHGNWPQAGDGDFSPDLSQRLKQRFTTRSGMLSSTASPSNPTSHDPKGHMIT